MADTFVNLTGAGTLYKDLRQRAARAGGNMAPEFSTASTYAVGDFCIYKDVLYRCTTAITTAGAWSASKWTAVKTMNEVADIKAYIVETSRDVADVQEDVSDLKSALNLDYLKSYNLQISSAERWAEFSNDCDNLTANRIYLISYSTGVAHLPYTGFSGFIITLTGVSNARSTGVQIAIRPVTMEMWQRSKWAGSWGNWVNLLDAINNTLSSHTASISALNIENLNDVESYGLTLSSAERWAEFSSDCNNLPINRIVVSTYNTGIAHLPVSGFNGFFLTFVGAYNVSSVKLQMAVHPTKLDFYIRSLWGGTWSAWTRLAFATDVSAMENDIHNLYYENDIWKVFHRVGIIGDSLASGESASNEGGTTIYHDLYQFSWGQCMARDSGNTYFNFSKGGLTTKTWYTDANYGYPAASQPDKICDMYIIGLGQNDAGQHMTVGTSADINMSNPDLNADTFYGNYGKIIQKMRELAPKAPIFVCSRPTVSASNEYETAIRAMPTLFSNVYLLDMYKHVNDYYDANSIIRRCLRSGHYNAVEISNVMKENLDDFLQVEFINTDWLWT